MLKSETKTLNLVELCIRFVWNMKLLKSYIRKN